jgi:hypothetical protein
MTRPLRVLLQASISFAEDDWHIGRFSLLARELGRWAEVTTRNHQPDASGDDPELIGLDRARFDELWLFGVDGGVGLSPAECAAVNRFQAAGGGLMTLRDHYDMGHWLRSLDRVGAANYFHDPACCEPDPERLCADDRETPDISWPNYHSGSNGDVERIDVVAPNHPLMQRATAAGGVLQFFPSHPHEGAVGAPAGESRASVIARGRSTVSGRQFDLVVAFERGDNGHGRAIAESSFHHFADYNWDISKGCPSFVSEPPSDAIGCRPELLDDIRQYVQNCVRWLAPA